MKWTEIRPYDMWFRAKRPRLREGCTCLNDRIKPNGVVTQSGTRSTSVRRSRCAIDPDDRWQPGHKVGIIHVEVLGIISLRCGRAYCLLSSYVWETFNIAVISFPSSYGRILRILQKLARDQILWKKLAPKFFGMLARVGNTLPRSN